MTDDYQAAPHDNSELKYQLAALKIRWIEIPGLDGTHLHPSTVMEIVDLFTAERERLLDELEERVFIPQAPSLTTDRLASFIASHRKEQSK